MRQSEASVWIKRHEESLLHLADAKEVAERDLNAEWAKRVRDHELGALSILREIGVCSSFFTRKLS